MSVDYIKFANDFIDSMNIIAESKRPGSGTIDKQPYIKKVRIVVDDLKAQQKINGSISDNIANRLIRSKVKEIMMECYNDNKSVVEPEVYDKPVIHKRVTRPTRLHSMVVDRSELL